MTHPVKLSRSSATGINLVVDIGLAIQLRFEVELITDIVSLHNADTPGLDSGHSC